MKLEYTKINDDYTIATIVYQNEDILKRNFFKDSELEIKSIGVPEFTYSSLFIRGYKTESDNRPIIIPNKHLEFVKEKVKKINEKYGIAKKWCPNIHEKYYYIYFGSRTNINYTCWNNTLMENRYLEKNLIFKTREEAEFVVNKMLENTNKWREEYQKQKKE